MEKLFPDPFLKNQNWACLWMNSQKFYTACFYCMTRWGLSNILTLSSRPLAFTHVKLFLKTKWFYDFWGKTFILLYSINWPNFSVWNFWKVTARLWNILSSLVFYGSAGGGVKGKKIYSNRKFSKIVISA